MVSLAHKPTNDHRFDDMLKDVRELGRESAMGKDALPKLALRAIAAAAAGVNIALRGKSASSGSGANAGASAGSGNTAAKDATGKRILSLSQITNNLPSGGLKRSQSVRAAAVAAAAAALGKDRKTSWASTASGSGVRKPKGYGELGGHNKENVAEVDEEDEEGQGQEEDKWSDLGDATTAVSGHEGKNDNGEEDGEPERVRKVSNGTTVITPPAADAEGDETEEDDDESESEWTEDEVEQKRETPVKKGSAATAATA